jgi:hypothetical protein
MWNTLKVQEEHFKLRPSRLCHRVAWSVGTNLTEERNVSIFFSKDRDSMYLQNVSYNQEIHNIKLHLPENYKSLNWKCCYKLLYKLCQK